MWSWSRGLAAHNSSLIHVTTTSDRIMTFDIIVFDIDWHVDAFLVNQINQDFVNDIVGHNY